MYKCYQHNDPEALNQKQYDTLCGMILQAMDNIARNAKHYSHPLSGAKYLIPVEQGPKSLPHQ